MTSLLEFFTLVQILAETSSGVISQLSSVLSEFSDWVDPKPTWWEMARDWQTLIAGLFAFLPAAVAAIFVWKQVNDQRSQFSRVQDAAALKARLRLSRNLSQISQHLDECFESLVEKNFDFDKHSLPQNLLDDVLDAGVASRYENFEFFMTYVEKLQTYASTCRIYEDIGGEENLVRCFFLLGQLDFMTDRMYPFSRFEVDVIDASEVSASEIKSQITQNLRRGKDIEGSNLEELLKLKAFDKVLPLPR